jgi:hypothetical protein
MSISSIGSLFSGKPELISNIIYMVYRLIAKYRPSMPVLSVVIPRLKTNQLRWSFTGAFEVHLFLLYLSVNICFRCMDYVVHQCTDNRI